MESVLTRYLAVKIDYAHARTEQFRLIKEASCYVGLT